MHPVYKYLTIEEIKREIDLLDESEYLFRELREDYFSVIENSVSSSAISELIFKDLEESKVNNDPFFHYEFDGIKFNCLYLHGWDMALLGISKEIKWLIFFYDEIIKQLETRLKGIDPTPEYFEELSNAARKEIVSGMASAKYYYWLKGLENKKEQNNPESDKPINNKSMFPRHVKTFSEYLDHNKCEALSKALKNEFTTEKGKGLRLVLEVLKQHNEFSFGYRENQAIYNAMALLFDREIGTKQSIFDCKIITDDPDFQVIETKVLGLLKTIKTNK